MGDVIESKALKILETYEGGNNYILELKERFLSKKNFFPTRTQAEYVIKFSNKNPKIARKWVKLDSYFANKIANDRLLIQIPDKIWIEKLLAEKDKAYHIWGKFFDDEKLTHFWMPKGSLIKDNTVKDVVIDFDKYSNRPPLNHQKEAIQKLVENKKFILADSMGLGKAEFIDNQVFTPNGRKKIGDLNIGDKVIGSNGESCSVIGVFPQGVKDLYRVTFSDGMSVLVCKEHLFSVQKNTKNKELVLSVEQMINKDLIIECYGSGRNKDKKYQFTSYYKANSNNNKWQIPIVKPIKFESKQLPINPYILGLILGDGSITGKSIGFTNSDFEILDYIEKLLPDDLQLKKEINTKYDYRITKKTGNFNSLIQELKKLNLMGCNSSTKFIPDIFKYSSVDDRLEILKGLMDTDGYCAKSKKNNFNGTGFSTVSKKLCDDVVEIVHSLGGIARVSSKTPKYKYNNEIRQGKLAYTVNIKLPEGMNPFKMTRKYELYNTPKKYKIARYIKDIKFEGQGEAVCISVDSSDNLYVTENAVVTHNTTSTIIAALETKAKKILIVCPATLKINWKKELENYTDKSIYIAEGKKFSFEEDFVIVNYDIIKNFHDIKDKKNSLITKAGFDLVILDECFTFNTKIMTEYGEMNIGDIVENGIDVKILSYNIKNKKLEYKKINRWIRKNKDTIYKIKLSNGVFIECTDNHKFYVKNKGYVKARELTKYDDLYVLSEKINRETNSEKKQILFKKLWINSNQQKHYKNRKRKKISKKLSELWKHNALYHRKENGEKDLLFSILCGKDKIKYKRNQRKKTKNYRKKWWMGGIYEKNSQKKSSYCSFIVATNERKQSNEKQRISGKNEEKIKRKNFFVKRWERKNNDTTRNDIQFVGRKLDYGISCTNQRCGETFQKCATFIQSRYWKSNSQNRNRNRWKISQNKKMEIFGQEENKNFKFVRVENIEILERGSYGRSAAMFEKNTRVYDLEIEDNHNYFANSVLVSNCHYIKNPQASRTKLINDIAKDVERLWLLTGTPMTSRPIDYYNLLNLVESPVANNWMAYVVRYCAGYQFKAGNRKVWNVMGASNLEELRERTSGSILRRLKENVLDLPEKIITPIYLRLNSVEYENVMGEYYNWYDKNPEESKSLTVQFTKITKVRQIIADEKVKNTIEIAENIIEQGKKVIIFCNFTDSLNKIYEHFKKTAVKLDGSMTKNARQESVDEFQNNEKIKVFVGNIKAAGVGITLTAAEAVIMNDLSFLPSDHAQAEDRAYRYGQKNSVLVYYPIFDNTIEGIIYDILDNKKKIISTVLGDDTVETQSTNQIMKRINERAN